MTKKTFKNRIQKILSMAIGIYTDEYWIPVHQIFNAISEKGWQVVISETKYNHNEDNQPISKTWKFTVIGEGFEIPCILTAHGAGSVADPLDRYDISAYCC